MAQDVYIQAWRDLRTLKNAESFLPWLRQLTRNKALSWVRGQRRYRNRHAEWEADSVEVAAREAGALELAIEQEERLVLEEAIEAMPEDSREVLTLFYREEQSIRHVAQLLGLSEAAVKKRLERARSALREDVSARFEQAARRSAPTAALTASVVAAITLGAPSTAAAATAAGTSLMKGVAGATAGAILGPLMGTVVGVGGVVFGMRKSIATAIDAKERTELTRYRDRWVVATVAFTAAIATLGWLEDRDIVDRHALAAVGVAVSITFMIFGVYASQRTLPRILARRRELERQQDPEGYALREARESLRRRLALAAGLTCALGGLGVAIYLTFAP